MDPGVPKTNHEYNRVVVLIRTQTKTEKPRALSPAAADRLLPSDGKAQNAGPKVNH
jgi:hypothetical protein